MSEVNDLRDMVSELRSHLDDSATTMRFVKSTALQQSQQIAGLRLLCLLGLCACVLQQAVLAWFQAATTATTGSSDSNFVGGNSGEVIFGSGVFFWGGVSDGGSGAAGPYRAGAYEAAVA